MRKLIILCSIALLAVRGFGQVDSTKSDKKEKKKTGWTFGAVPAIAFDTDIGFKYGAVVNFYNYGDGSTYPQYKHSIFCEWSRTTKGSGINRVFYDSKYLLPKQIRTTLDFAFLTEKALDFYGFNGYNSEYKSEYVDDGAASYISRVYYRHERKLTRITADFQGNLSGKKLRWFAGAGFYGNKIASVDINKLNENLSDSKKLPDTAGLYDKYVSWGVIPADQKNGGNTGYVRGGLIYDTRDNEPNPMHGIWTEAILLAAPTFLSNTSSGYAQLIVIHRQYFTLVKDRLSLAGRLAYQGKIAGDMPYYMMPILMSSYQARDGVGGAKSIRGVMRNRVVGEGVTYGNIELRWKAIRTVVFNQNLYIALSSFFDGGMVVQKYRPDLSGVPADQLYLFNSDSESLHKAVGGGLHIALNENFIVAVDYGRALDKRDGKSGLYINMDWLF
jgi:hypothetical protein